MENEQNEQSKSGSTTPTYPKSMTSVYPRSDDSDSVTSTHGSESVSTTSVAPPAPPVNSPATMSEAGGVASLDFAMVHMKLGEGAGVPTPPSSSASDISEGKAHIRGRVRSEYDLRKQLFKAPPVPVKKKSKRVTRRHLETVNSATCKSKHSNTSPPDTHVHEQNTWMAFAAEDLERSLKRLAMGAKDKHKIDDSKTVEEYYSEELAKQIREGEVKFDSKLLE